MRMLARVLASGVAAVGLFLLTPAAPASAHVTLKAASPAEGATLQAAPARVELRFSAVVAVDRTAIELTGPGGARVTAAKPSGSGSRVAVALSGSMANGGYTVSYRTLSSDGHTVKGTYRFTLATPAPPKPTAPTPAPAPTTPASTTPAPATATLAPAAAETEDGGIGGGTVAAAVAIPVLALAGAGLVLARRRTSG